MIKHSNNNSSVIESIDSAASIIDLETVTTNGYYGTFSYAWTTPHEGTYEIMASFVADESYVSSSASTQHQQKSSILHNPFQTQPKNNLKQKTKHPHNQKLGQETPATTIPTKQISSFHSISGANN